MELGFYLGLCVSKDLLSAPLFLCWVLELSCWDTPLTPYTCVQSLPPPVHAQFGGQTKTKVVPLLCTALYIWHILLTAVLPIWQMAKPRSDVMCVAGQSPQSRVLTCVLPILGTGL